MERKPNLTNLICITQDLSEVIDDHGQTDVIYTDFRKVFDQVDHYILLEKLRRIGFSDSLISLSLSFTYLTESTA